MKLKIISDGTNNGTKLIDEETGQMVHGISKLTWEADAKKLVAKVTVELTNVPIEATCKADVKLFECQSPNWEMVHTKSFEKEIKIVTKDHNGRTVLTPHVKIFDAETNEPVGAVQKITWKATPKGSRAKIKKIKFEIGRASCRER